MFPEESGLRWINTVEDTETSMETSTGKGIRTTHVLSMDAIPYRADSAARVPSFWAQVLRSLPDVVFLL